MKLKIKQNSRPSCDAGKWCTRLGLHLERGNLDAAFLLANSSGTGGRADATTFQCEVKKNGLASRDNGVHCLVHANRSSSCIYAPLLYILALQQLFPRRGREGACGLLEQHNVSSDSAHGHNIDLQWQSAHSKAFQSDFCKGWPCRTLEQCHALDTTSHAKAMAHAHAVRLLMQHSDP